MHTYTDSCIYSNQGVDQKRHDCDTYEAPHRDTYVSIQLCKATQGTSFDTLAKPGEGSKWVSNPCELLSFHIIACKVSSSRFGRWDHQLDLVARKVVLQCFVEITGHGNALKISPSSTAAKEVSSCDEPSYHLTRSSETESGAAQVQWLFISKTLLHRFFVYLMSSLH